MSEASESRTSDCGHTQAMCGQEYNTSSTRSYLAVGFSGVPRWNFMIVDPLRALSELRRTRLLRLQKKPSHRNQATITLPMIRHRRFPEIPSTGRKLCAPKSEMKLFQGN